MLAAQHRLRDSGAFRRTVRYGRRAGGPALVAHLLVGEPAAGSEPVRVGFVVSKEIGGAVARNQVRRRLRHLVGSHLGTLPSSAELVVRALPASRAMDSAELGVELTRCLERVCRGDSAAVRTGAPS